MDFKSIYNDSGESAKPIQEIEHGLDSVLNLVNSLIQYQEISREKHAFPKGEMRLLYLAQGHAICVDSMK